VPQLSSHHDAYLPLELDLLRLRRQHDRFAAIDETRWRLEKDEWLGRNIVAELTRVLEIVATNTDDLRRALSGHTDRSTGSECLNTTRAETRYGFA